MFENPLIESGLRRRIHDSKKEIYFAVHQALRASGIDDAYVTSIEFRMARTAPKCPPGTEPSLEVIERPDGSFLYQIVCK